MSLPEPEREMNIPLMRKALEWVEAQAALPQEQSEWYQWAWRSNLEGSRDCGTAYCVAGYICEIDPDSQWISDDPRSGAFDLLEPNDEEKSLGMEAVDAGARASSLLGIHPHAARPIFTGSNTASRIRELMEEVAGETL